MGDSNIALQADEIEALASIYGDKWDVVNESSRCYSIEITDEEYPDTSLLLQVTLPPDYPTSAPPQYQISAPWVRGQEKIEIGNSLEDIYCENMGESIIYLWVEKLREFLIEHMEKGDSHSEQDLITEKVFGPEPPNSPKEHNDQSEDAEDYQYTYDADAAMKHLHLHSHIPNKEDETAEECPKVISGETVSDRRSVFQPFLAAVYSQKQVDQVMSKLRENRKIDVATHRILAYRIETPGPSSGFLKGCDDDGEFHASSRMLHLLDIVDARNVMVVVVRWYGGVHLGPDRFKHINNCTREILEVNGYIKDRNEKKGGKSAKRKSHGKKT